MSCPAPNFGLYLLSAFSLIAVLIIFLQDREIRRMDRENNLFKGVDDARPS